LVNNTRSNAPSNALASNGFGTIGAYLNHSRKLLIWPEWLRGALMDGIYNVFINGYFSNAATQMAIFFPLFTLLERFRYLPRVASLDKFFCKTQEHVATALDDVYGLIWL